MKRELHLLVPGPLEQRTGGYLYDARMVSGLRDRGWDVQVHSLVGSFPTPDPAARDSMTEALEAMDDGSLVVADGLAMGALPEPVAAHASRLRVVSLLHHPLAEETGLTRQARERLRALEAEALAHVRGVVVTSVFTARRLREWGVERDRVRVVVPGTERPRSSQGGIRARSGTPLLLSVGSVTPRKGQDVLLEALDRIRDLSWRCVVVGSLERDREFAARVQARRTALGMADRMELPGELDREALDDLYAAAHLFVLPSHYEGYGMVLAEALVHGLPVVSTSGGAIPDTVPTDAGILVAPGDPVALADGIRALLQDPARRAACARAARRHGDSLPTWTTQVAAFEAALTEFAADV